MEVILEAHDGVLRIPRDALIEGGRVFVSGEYWNAVSDQEIEEGEPCEIEEIHGLMMKVRPIEPPAGPAPRS